jgi:hypothetical protein
MNMITLKQYFETINYRVSEGYNFQWQCYGPNAYGLESVDNRCTDGHSVGIVFDTQDQTVYQVEAHDHRNGRSYRLNNPLFDDARRQECARRNLDPDDAYDTVKFVDLETTEDFLEKATAIIRGEDYDTRVSVPLELPDDMLFALMKQAHEQDITLNEHMENVLRMAIEDLGAKHGISS